MAKQMCVISIQVSMQISIHVIGGLMVTKIGAIGVVKYDCDTQITSLFKTILNSIAILIDWLIDWMTDFLIDWFLHFKKKNQY